MRVNFLFSPIIGLFILCMVTNAANAEGVRCTELNYGPTQVKLTGRILQRVYPGPPNYQSIRAGDRREVADILQLAKKICVRADMTDLVNEAERNIKEIQLVFLDRQSWENDSSKRVIVGGRLFHAHSGHHHTKVLLEVDSIASAE